MHRLMEEVIAPSGLPVLSHARNELPNVPKTPSVRSIAAHLGVGLLGLRNAAIPLYLPAPFVRVLEMLAISEEAQRAIGDSGAGRTRGNSAAIIGFHASLPSRHSRQLRNPVG
jgi:hypothetical protein